MRCNCNDEITRQFTECNFNTYTFTCYGLGFMLGMLFMGIILTVINAKKTKP